MKNIALALVLLSAVSAPALAGSCVVLEYQEMKDMSTEELLKQACAARMAGSQSMDEKIKNLDAGAGRLPFPNAQQNFDQCVGQIDRIDRVLAAKGMSKEAVIAACQGRAGSNTTTPAESK